MDIPTDTAKRINPDIQDPISKSVVYTFSSRDVHYDRNGYAMYKFPYSKDTYWTNFKYACYNITKNEPAELEMGIELVTSDNYEYCVKMLQSHQNKVWYDTEWPFPSIYTVGERAGIYFKVKFPSDNDKYSFNIFLLGFMDLFPKVENYILLSTLDTYQTVFSKYEQDDLDGARGNIWNVENYDYIREIMVKACGLRLIKRY
jgi:hypothetical protein